MRKINKLLKFINENPNWKELIQKEPYNIMVKEDGKYTLLKYNQLESDFFKDIVCCSRGIIFNDKNEVVCFPFYKFFNYGEPQADEIDWDSAKIQEKIDGSLIKLWYDNDWHISTNGGIDAYNSPISETETYGDIFEEVRNSIDFEKLNKNNTYMFELVSPKTQVVILYPETKLYHIGTRNNKTYKELDEDIGVEKPKEYKFDSLEDLIEASKKLCKDQEGYVVVDKNYKRIKVKSPAYLIAHYLKNNQNFDNKRCLEIIKEGEEAEVLTYFPELQDKFDQINFKIFVFLSTVYSTFATLIHAKGVLSRKEYVIEAKKEGNLFPFLMTLYDNSNKNLKLELLNMKAEKIMEVLDIE